MTFNKCSIKVLLYNNVNKNQQGIEAGFFPSWTIEMFFFQHADGGSETDKVIFFQDYYVFFINKLQTMKTLNQVNLKNLKT